MRFDEPVEISFGAIRVYDTEGNRVDVGDAEHIEGEADAVWVPVEPSLPRGTYTVTWRVVSADGHAISEAFVFHVEAPGERPQGIADQVLAATPGSGRTVGILYGMTRWISFASLLMLAGAVVFIATVWRRRAETMQRPSDVELAFLHRWRLIAVASLLAALVATLASFVLQGAVAADVSLVDALSGPLLGDLARTRFGMVALARLVLLVAVAVLLFVLHRGLMQRQVRESVGAASAPEGLPVWILAAGGLLVLGTLATPGLQGHAGTTDPVVLNLATDTLHLTAAAVWSGGLVLLLAACFPATRRLTERDAVSVLAPVVSRFSNMAMVAVAVIVATGVYRAWLEVGALRGLTGATYGWVLLTKVGAFVPLVAMGAINNRVTKPRLARAAAAKESADASLRMLRRLVAVEVTLVAVVLALTALLVNLPPARVAAGLAGPFVRDVQIGEYDLNVLIDPNEVGENEVHLTVTTAPGAPTAVKDMRVLFRMPEKDIGPLVGTGTRLAKGHFVVQGHQLSVAGDWQLEIVARFTRFGEERATVTATVNE